MHHTPIHIIEAATPTSEWWSTSTITLHPGDTATIPGTTKAVYVGPGTVEYVIDHTSGMMTAAPDDDTNTRRVRK